jgi:hypothetical protein
MPRPKSNYVQQCKSIALARQKKSMISTVLPDNSEAPSLSLEPGFDPENDSAWMGRVNHCLFESDYETAQWSDAEPEDSDDEIVELTGEVLVESLREEEEKKTSDRNIFEAMGMYGMLTRRVGQAEWTKAEANRSLGYTKNSVRTHRRHRQQAREKEEKDRHTRQS